MTGGLDDMSFCPEAAAAACRRVRTPGESLILGGLWLQRLIYKGVEAFPDSNISIARRPLRSAYSVDGTSNA